MPKKKDHKRRCFACGKMYDPLNIDYGKYGKGGWRTCSPWCSWYDRARML